MSCELVEAMQHVTTPPRKNRPVRPTPPAWELMDRLRAAGRGGSPIVEMIAPLAGLLVLRWAAFHEAEQEAVAAFDDHAFEPLLPLKLRQLAWTDRTIADHLAGELRTLQVRHDTDQARYVAAVAPVLQ
ncbi:MAG: hypothetical protein KC492_00050, partial [Myxococcales bacterium]|nr:hypothetical protein [Myxococcales bacterium]